MGKKGSSRLLTAKELRRYGNCFVWTGSSAQALRPRPPARPDESPKPEAPKKDAKAE